MNRKAVKVLNVLLVLAFAFGIYQLGIDTLKFIFTGSSDFWASFYFTGTVCFIFALVNILPGPPAPESNPGREFDGAGNAAAEVSFKAAEEDVLKFYNFNQKHSKQMKKIDLLGAAAALFLFNAVVALFSPYHALLDFGAGLVLAALFSYSMWQLRKKKFLGMYYRQNPNAQKERTVALYEDGLGLLAGEKGTFTEWNSNMSVHEYGKDIVFYFSPRLGLVIPARAFHDQDDRDYFYHFIRERIPASSQ